MKNFAKTKNSRMFAVPKIIQIVAVSVFLCTANSVLANNTGYQIPILGNTTAKFVIVFGETGGDSLSYIHTSNKFSSKMPKTTKITNPVNNSNGIGTPYGAKSVLSATQSNDQGCNISGNIKNIKIINGISADQLQTAIKNILKEFIDSGLITLLSNEKNENL